MLLNSNHKMFKVYYFYSSQNLHNCLFSFPRKIENMYYYYAKHNYPTEAIFEK